MQRAEPDPRVVLLDLGDVLVRVQYERTMAHWARAASMLPAAVEARVRADETYERYERGELDFASYAEHLRACLGADLDDATLLEGWNLALGDALPGAARLVAEVAARWPVYLFSNTNAAHHHFWRREHAELLSSFTEVFVSHQLAARKPDARAYRQVVAEMGVAAEEVAFFDDREENVTGAATVGLMAWRVDGPRAVARILGITC